ncbi:MULTISPECIES: type II toxin-antitoxin system PemK/MazF family toxin [unclassified Actinomyces]|uniref:type II toxin-antitoxin system PemK/MazF family toxin n=1 Tax=unclassified Actinomyces TaxID=2609248 RepID=UPI002016FFB9|nr:MULTISPECIES: type II toxin-antitoxin system PemK/MazF family toxin [unclassified Actinomyces]
MDVTPRPLSGEVWWARPDPSVSRELTGRRPVLVVSNEQYHQVVTTLVITVPLTTRDRGWSNHVLVGAESGPGRPSLLTRRAQCASFVSEVGDRLRTYHATWRRTNDEVRKLMSGSGIAKGRRVPKPATVSVMRRQPIYTYARKCHAIGRG